MFSKLIPGIQTGNTKYTHNIPEIQKTLGKLVLHVMVPVLRPFLLVLLYQTLDFSHGKL